jgi:rhodanese-related sulfurtransferase
MAIDHTSQEGAVIRRLIPLASIPIPSFKALCDGLMVEEIKDDFLFKRGDTDNRLVYLLSGSVSLQAQGLVVDTIEAQQESARFALAHQIPRKIDALAKGTVRFLRLQADALKLQKSTDRDEHHDESYVVEEQDIPSQDWMADLLKAPLFQQLCPTHLQKVIMNLEESHFPKGAIILEQGYHDDMHYIIKNGTCLLSHKPHQQSEPIKLAQIGKGHTLGEDALILDVPRLETVTALTDVTLIGLARAHFMALIKEAVIKQVNFLEMQQILLAGATILDVRPSAQYRQRHLHGSINIPFTMLKQRYKMLPLENPAIVVSEEPLMAEAATFLLIKHRYHALVLQGGIQGITVLPENESLFFDSGNGLEQPDSDWQETVAEQNQWQSTPPILNPEVKMALLQLENERLKKTYAHLQDECIQLREEKDAIERQCRMLNKQIQKMRQVLDKFKALRHMNATEEE